MLWVLLEIHKIWLCDSALTGFLCSFVCFLFGLVKVELAFFSFLFFFFLPLLDIISYIIFKSCTGVSLNSEQHVFL
jgi:hypothetical protein